MVHLPGMPSSSTGLLRLPLALAWLHLSMGCQPDQTRHGITMQHKQQIRRQARYVRNTFVHPS